MSGMTDLAQLIASMEPELEDGEFVYCTVPATDLKYYLPLKPRGLFWEKEGLTLILPAGATLPADVVTSAAMRQITLNVHSSLDAVGLTAAFAKALTEAGISANVVAGFYHDHIFVPVAHAEPALAALRKLSATARA